MPVSYAILFIYQCPLISELSLLYGPVSLIIRRRWSNCVRNQKRQVLLMLFCHYVQGSPTARNNIAGLGIVEPQVLFFGYS